MDAREASFPGSSPAFCCILYNMGREPGQFDHVHDDVLCMVLCVVWVIEFLPMHSVFECLTVLETESPSTVDCHSV